MKKKNLILLATSIFVLGTSLASCNASGVAIYAVDFVNSLVSLKGLTPDSGKYIFTETFINKATEYTYTLTCTEDSTFDYVFDSFIEKKIVSGSVEGYIRSDVKFLWARFSTSLFVGSAELISGSVKTTPKYQFYGLVYQDDGTLKNTCYFTTLESKATGFDSVAVVDDSGGMTILNVQHLNELTKACVNTYVW